MAATVLAEVPEVAFTAVKLTGVALVAFAISGGMDALAGTFGAVAKVPLRHRIGLLHKSPLADPISTHHRIATQELGEDLMDAVVSTVLFVSVFSVLYVCGVSVVAKLVARKPGSNGSITTGWTGAKIRSLVFAAICLVVLQVWGHVLWKIVYYIPFIAYLGYCVAFYALRPIQAILTCLISYSVVLVSISEDGEATESFFSAFARALRLFFSKV